MKIQIGVPSNSIYDLFAENAKLIKEKYNVDVIRLSESQCREKFLNHILDAAFLSPIGYGLGVINGDFRIIPGPCLSVEGYSEIVSMYFNPGLKSIKTCLAPDSDDYLIQISKIILAERYNMLVTMANGKGSVSDQLQKADAVLAYGLDKSIVSSMDMTEDWMEHFEQILPVGYWVTRSEEFPENIAAIISELAADTLPRQINLVEKDCGDGMAREGKILFFWDERIEEALDQTLHLLYYHQLLPEIGAVKIFGQDIQADIV